MSFWGKYRKDEKPKVHFDPLASFLREDRKVGYRIHVVKSRGNRPRDYELPSASITSPKTHDEDYKQKSVLYRISRGREVAVFIAADDEVLGSPSDQPIEREMTNFKAISVMNKFSPLDISGHEASGAALVIFPTTYIESLRDASVNSSILRANRTSINSLMGTESYRDDLRTPMTFFNIGPSSGASLKMLHAQTYVTPYAAGLLTFTFNEAFRAMKTCITCKIANKDKVIDSLDQSINLLGLTISEDKYVRMHVPYAPIRPLSVRIQIKRHVAHLGMLTDDELISLGQALAWGHEVILHSSPPNWPIKQDRTIAFRQTRDRDDDFHMFVDIMPTIPLGGAEVIDSLSVTSIDPYHIAQRMKSVFSQIK